MVSERTVGVNGMVRHFTLIFPVLDPQLLQRLSAEVQIGDEIKAIHRQHLATKTVTALIWKIFRS